MDNMNFENPMDNAKFENPLSNKKYKNPMDNVRNAMDDMRDPNILNTKRLKE